MSCSLTFRQVEQARERLASHILDTPTVTNNLLNESLGCKVFWKLESLQQTNAFKVRGALNRLLDLTNPVSSDGVIAASSGNHGIGVAFAAKTIGVPATIFMPLNAPIIKQERASQNGASVILRGRNYNEALSAAEEYSRAHNMTLISNYNDPLVIAGHGTLTLEVLDQLEEIDDFVVPVGGGGLAASVGIVLSARRPLVRIYGVQPRAAASCYESRLAGKQVTTLPAFTLADGLVCTTPGEFTFPIVQRTIHDILLVDDRSILGAIETFLNILKIVIEPAGAIGLAAIATYPKLFSNRRVACICTGANVDFRILNEILEAGRPMTC
jgi:threonine dehydratase